MSKFKRTGLNVEQAPSMRPQLNVHPIFDALTGSYLKGTRGEMVLNGGLWNLVAIVGEGNVGKSTLMNDIALSIVSHHPSAELSTYDTESNFQATRMYSLSRKYPALIDEDFLTGEGRYKLVSSVEVDGEVWNDNLKKYGNEKIKDKSNYGTTPFIDSHVTSKVTAIKYPYPDIRLIDSLSEFQTGEQRKKAEKHDIDDKEMNNFAMVDGGQKTRMLQEWSRFLTRTGQFIIFTGHVGETINMGNTPPRKKLNYMRQGSKAKGIPQKTEFLTHHYWDIIKSQNLYNSDRSDVHYPTAADRGNNAKTDLMRVYFQGLRNKSGPSGIQVSIIISQSKGVLWGLSCYDMMLEHQYGLEEVKKYQYELAFYPGVTLQRTTVRDVIDGDVLLQRALELSTEIMIMSTTRVEFPLQYRHKLKDIYEKVIAAGYDWNKILRTRGYWLFEEEIEADTPQYLSGLDLIRIALGEYDLPNLKV